LSQKPAAKGVEAQLNKLARPVQAAITKTGRELTRIIVGNDG